MKLFSIFLGIIGLSLLFACNQDDDCGGTFAIEKVLPDNNPPGSEVSIVGTGFSNKSVVRFAGQIAKSSFSNEKGLVAVVPNNVTGFLDLTVEEGDCLARTDFEVLGTLPVNWVASPTVIVIPTFPQNFPSNISNQWINYFDNDHILTIVQGDDCFGVDEVELSSSSCFESHSKNSFLNDNPITGIYQCVGERTVTINIDRRKKGAGIDTLEGSIIEPESVGEDGSDGKGYMLLTSKATGRQYVFFRN